MVDTDGVGNDRQEQAVDRALEVHEERAAGIVQDVERLLLDVVDGVFTVSLFLRFCKSRVVTEETQLMVVLRVFVMVTVDVYQMLVGATRCRIGTPRVL